MAVPFTEERLIMRRSTDIFCQAIAAMCVGAIAYACVLQEAMRPAPSVAPSIAARTLAAGVAIVSASIAAFMVGCMFRDLDQDWPDPAGRRPIGAGSGKDIDLVGSSRVLSSPARSGPHAIRQGGCPVRDVGQHSDDHRSFSLAFDEWS